MCVLKQKGNVLRYLHPTKIQMLMGKNFQMCSKYPSFPNVHDVHDVHMSKCPYVHDMVTLVTCGQTCHMWSHLLHVVTLVTCGQTCHMRLHLSHVVTLVTNGHIVTCGHTCHMWSHYHIWSHM